jgi:hypothetical protein
LVRPTYAFTTSRTDGLTVAADTAVASGSGVGYDVVAAERGSTAVTNTSNRVG